MSFHNGAIFPDGIAYGMSGGPRFRTTVNSDFAGNESRNIEWNQARREFRGEFESTGSFDGSVSQFDALLAFHMARQGRAFGFRFKDWNDYTATDQPVVRLDGNGDPVESGGLLVSTGDGAATVFQLYEQYASGSKSFFREITRPRDEADIPSDPGVQVAFRIRVDSLVQTETTDYTIDRSTGRVTFVSPPGNGLAVDWSGEFDVPVRFSSDQLEVDIPNFSQRVLDVRVLEIRNEADV